ncbi:MAG: hypothetical protein J6L90_04415 [Clostridia bacterium]|nr:hypothetical protein [Clostridia bacterium]
MKIKKLIAAILALATVLAITLALTVGTNAATDSMPTASNGQTVDVWLIAGQSNAVGYGKVANYPTDSKYASDKALLTNGSDNVYFYGKDEVQANFSSYFVKGAFGLGQESIESGAEIGITTALNGNGRMNAIIKLAYGSSYIFPNTNATISQNRGTWTPPSYIEKHGINTTGNKTGDLYYNFLQTVSEGLDMLKAKGYTPVIRGMWWMQGCAETFTAETSGAYQELLTTLIKDLRRDLTELSGTACYEMPFVYGRLYRKAGDDPDNAGQTYRDRTPYLTAVQAAQDAVSKDTSLKNVFMVTSALVDDSNHYDVGTAVDLLDPATGEKRTPTQEDGWHYDAFTQQMLGEAFVRKASSVGGDVTPYGIVPSSETLPFAVFKRSGDSYEFDACYELRGALERAKDLTLASLAQPADEVVVYLRRDVTNTDYARGTGLSGSKITVDLGGHTITNSGNGTLLNSKVEDCFYAGEPRAATLTFKNGKILAYKYALVYNEASGGSYTKEKKLTYNFENVELGFAPGATLGTALLGIDLANYAQTGIDIKYEFNYKNCTIDASTNCPASIKGLISSNVHFAPDTANEYGYSDYLYTFEGCTFNVKTMSDFNFNLSAEGDTVRFKKDKNGSFGKILSGDTAACTDTFIGIDDGGATVLAVKSAGTTEGSYNLYSIGLADGQSLPTAYAPIPKDYSDAEAYSLALFKKTASGYEFTGGYNDWKKVMEAAVSLAHATTGVTDEAVILLRRDAVFSSYPQHITNLGHTITVDLNGYELTLRTSMFNTQTADYAEGLTPETVKCGTINVKNGRLLTRDFGLAYTRTNDSGKAYTVEKTLYMNFDGVYIGFSPEAPGTNRTKTNLLVHAYRCDLETNENFVFNYKNCIIDLATNTTSAARLGTAQTFSNDNGSDTRTLSNADFKLFFEGCKFICYSPEQVGFLTKSASGDTITFVKDAFGDYSSVYLTVDNSEPDSSYLYDADDGGKLSYLSTDTVEGLYRKYKLVSSHVNTKYGAMPRADYYNVTAIFTKNGTGYSFYKSYASYKAAFEAAAVLTDGSSDAYSEAVILLLRDYNETGIPKYACDICSQVTLDLNNYTLTVNGSFFNTWLRKSSGNTANIYIKNGTLLTSQYGFVYTAPGTDGAAYDSEKTINVTFDNTYLGFAEGHTGKYMYLLAQAYNGSTTTNTKINITVKNSTLDLYNNTTSASSIGDVYAEAIKDTPNTVDFDTRFVDCSFITHDPSQLSYSVKSDSGDTVSFVKGTDGSYPTVLTPHTEAYSNSFVGRNGSSTETVYLNVTGNTALSLIEYTFTTAKPEDIYAPITSTYADKEAYPFAVFYKEGSGYKFYKAYDSYKSAFESAAIPLTRPSASSLKSEVVVLLRRDFSATTFPNNTGHISTLVTVDLNGYHFGAHGSLGNTKTEDSKSGNTIVATNGTITYKNGSITVLQHPLLYAAMGSAGYTKGYEKTMTMNFVNVDLSFSAAYNNHALFGRVASEYTTARMTHYMNFTNCTVDLSTNKSTSGSYYSFNGVYSSTSDYTDMHISFAGCTFKAAAATDFSAKLGSGDSVTFKNAPDGTPTTFVLPSGASAPANTYCLTGYKFQKQSDDGTSVIYKLTHTAAQNIGFTPKTSITLDSSLIFNIYIPDSDALISATLDGVAIDFNTLELRNGYYLVSIPLVAKEAARDIKLGVTLSTSSGNVSGTFTMSVVRYANKLLASSTSSAEERTLICDVLAYIKSAYNYFGTASLGELAPLDEALGSYRSEFTNVSSTNTLGDALAGATFVLDATPAIRFYLPEGRSADSYTFSIDGKAVKYTVGKESASGSYNGLTYVDISLFAYRMTESIECHIDGVSVGEFSIGAYYAYVSGTGYTADNKLELCDLVEKFINYSKSARAYRNAVTK